MDLQLVERKAFSVCGYAVETTLENNDRDISDLYCRFFNEKKDLLDLSGCKKGYYGLSWYTVAHEKFCYLLGMEVEGANFVPKDALLKNIPKATYAVTVLQDDSDIKEDWKHFFYGNIPDAGFAPNEQHGYYFEYYPKSVYGLCELWVPVVKIGE